MVEKTKQGSEAAQRVATVQPGQGILAYMKIYTWYAGTTGLALKRRTEMVMNLPTPSRDEVIANVIEDWAEQVRLLANFDAAHNCVSLQDNCYQPNHEQQERQIRRV